MHPTYTPSPLELGRHARQGRREDHDHMHMPMSNDDQWIRGIRKDAPLACDA